mgnify:CR=1 FL=1
MAEIAKKKAGVEAIETKELAKAVDAKKANVAYGAVGLAPKEKKSSKSKGSGAHPPSAAPPAT